MIHKFSLDGHNIAVDVYSGMVHILDEIAFDVIDYYQENDADEIVKKLSNKHDRQQIIEAIEELKQIEVQGLLFLDNPYTEAFVPPETEPIVKALCLHVAHDCNLRCEYCFASKGDFGHTRTLMSSEIAKKAIDFLLENSGSRKNLELDFFGGEPLMNFEVVKETVEYGREREKEFGKNIRFTLTTNGVLLNDEIKEYLNENMSNVVLSIDGRPGVNDKMRYRVDGSGSYHSILPKIKDFAESRNQERYYVRGTFTAHNLDFSEDVIHLANQGFKQISIEPVVAGEGNDYALKREHIGKICAEYEKLAQEFIKRHKEGNEFNFFHFQLEMDGGPCAAKRFKGCGAGEEYLAITPEGDIYPCHQFVGNEEFRMGNVETGKVNQEIREKFKKANILNNPKCKDCWCKFFCSGGCTANAWLANKDLNIPYELGCELQKKRVECAIMIKAALNN